MWYAKVSIPSDVQHIFGKRAFKKSLRTANKIDAIARSGPIIAGFKDAISEARGNPTQHLDDYLKHTQDHLRAARKSGRADMAAIEGIEEEALDTLLKAYRVQQAEDLPAQAFEEVRQAYKVTTGQQTLFDGPLEEYAKSRRVEPKTEAKDRHAVAKFAKQVATVQEVDKSAVKDFVEMLSTEEGLKSRTIRDNLMTLRVYWDWLADRGYAPEDRPNPFSKVTLPAENRKEAAAKQRLEYTPEDIRKLHKAIDGGRSDMMRAIFLLAIYTGCRIEELASLETTNVTEETITITHAKTAAGNRTIPVHDAIKPLIRNLLAKGDTYLLPDLVPNKYGARSPAMSKQFGKVKSKLGYDGRYTFHGLRQTVATMMEQAGVPEGIAADILGHKKKTMSYGLYSGGSSFEQKREAVLKLDYGILWHPVEWSY